MDQRLQFLSSYQREEMSVTDLCHEFGISRPTAYRWINRYKEVGPEGLLDLSRGLSASGCSITMECDSISQNFWLEEMHEKGFRTRGA